MPTSIIDEIRQSQGHATRIRDLLNGRVNFESREALFRTPVTLFLFSNRSGSNLLAEHLLASGKFAGMQEYLNFESVEAASKINKISSFPEYLCAIAKNNINDKIFGTKCSLDQLIMLLRWNILSMFSGAKIINIERHDVVSQAVSMSIASQTKSWSNEITSTVVPTYNFDEISHYFTHFSGDVIKRRAVIDLLGFDAITFEYEQVVSEPLHVVSECCRLFGITAPDAIPEKTRLKKQGGELNRQFSERFRQEARERLLSGA